MYNPFPLLNEKLLKDKIGEGKRYFVRQYYARGMEPKLKASFLLRAYEADETELAQKHLQSIKADQYAFLYDTEIPEELRRLVTAARQPFGYKIFYAGKKGIEWKPPTIYQEKMKNYIRKKHPTWRSPRFSKKIQAGLSEEFGQLFLTLSYEEEEDRIHFEEIEKY
jgi:hypothetical protein